jgi:general secretion pathway protein A
VLVINPAIGFEEMLRFILSDLGRPPEAAATKLDMLEVLNVELLDTLARGGNVVVLIDEAQDLTIPVLEELRLLSNLETAKEKILQLVLAGQPEFDALLARPEIRQLRQRISVSARLRPLARSEVAAYVGARIAAAGGDVRGLFTKPALFRLWWFSGGVPRLVNAACDNALVTAYARGKRTIGWREIGEAMRDLRRQVTWAPSRFGRLFTMLAAALVGGGLALGALALLRDGWPPTLQRLLPGAVPTVVAVVAQTSSPVATAIPSPTAVVAAAPSVAMPASATPVDVPTVVASATPTVEAPTSTPEATRTPEPVASPRVEPTRVRRVRVANPDDLRLRVAEGDTLTDLAVRYYGSASPKVLAMIKAANPWLNDPNVIWVGRTLVLPPPRVSDAAGEAGDGTP